MVVAAPGEPHEIGGIDKRLKLRLVTLDLGPPCLPDGMSTYAAYHVMRGGVDPTGMASANVLMPYYDRMIDNHKGYIYAGVTNIIDLLNAMKKSASSTVKSVVPLSGNVPPSTRAQWDWQRQILEFDRQKNETTIKPGSIRLVSLFHESIHIRHTEQGKYQRDSLYDTLQDEHVAYAAQYLYEGLSSMRSFEDILRDGDPCPDVQAAWRRLWKRYNNVPGQKWSTKYDGKDYDKIVHPLYINGVYKNHEEFHVSCPKYLKAIQAKYPDTKADGACCLTCDKGNNPGDLDFDLHWIFKVQLSK